MKRTFIIVLLLIIIITGGCFNKKNNTNQSANLPASQERIDFIREMVNNYDNYKYAPEEAKKIIKGDNGYFYYLGADNKRHTFPDIVIFKSWFKDIDTEKLQAADLQTLYKTQLSNINVTLRPGTLVGTPSLNETYLTVGNGRLRAFADENMLKVLYGDNWKNLVVIIPEYYFSQYTVIEPLTSYEDFPTITNLITIDQDLGLQ